MIVAGVMSGTSADGVDVALVRILRASGETRLKFLGHASLPYSATVRRLVLGSMNSARASVADLARLNFRLGELYAEAVLSAQKKLRFKCDLVGCHGQTLYHQGTPAPFLGKKLAVTWQTGEAAVIAARTGVPVVSDFRPADMARGGQGAPLVPYLDYLLYRDPRIGRIALNLGGIANLTAIPAGAASKDVIAFDTGPGNMVIDQLAEGLFRQAYDRDGGIASSGQVDEKTLAAFLRNPFFRQKPPKTSGREEFGREFGREFLKFFASASASRGRSGSRKHDAVATATALTTRSIANAVKRFVLPRGRYAEMIASGGGTRNPILMAGLANEMSELGIRLRSSDEFGIPSEAKEAVAFAALAFETWHRRPSNVPSATGAKRAAVLGKISYP
jgi:anhydro-N-acetylmuramic acid kinase